LWTRLCAGELPARCTKQWYFETFCGVDAGAFEQGGFDGLDARTPIVSHLNGFVKPYDGAPLGLCWSLCSVSSWCVLF
jgi:hypothetical protein